MVVNLDADLAMRASTCMKVLRGLAKLRLRRHKRRHFLDAKAKAKAKSAAKAAAGSAVMSSFAGMIILWMFELTLDQYQAWQKNPFGMTGYFTKA